LHAPYGYAAVLKCPDCPKLEGGAMNRVVVIAVAVLALVGVSVAYAPTSWASVCQVNGAGCTLAGTYPGPNAVISSDYDGFKVVWTESVVQPYSSGVPLHWTAYVTYTNTGPSGLTFACAGDWQGASYVSEKTSGGNGDDGMVPAGSTTCSEHPGLAVTVAPRGTHGSFATFNNVPWPGSAVAITWGDAGTSPSVNPFEPSRPLRKVGSSDTVLTLEVAYLPGGTSGDVTVRGPRNFDKYLGSTSTLRHLRPGTYKVAAGEVRARGNVYVPTVSRSPLTLQAGTTTTVTVSYLDTVPDNTKVLSSSDIASATISNGGSTLRFKSVAAAGDPAPGDVLVAGATPATPYGLLRKVTSVTAGSSGVVVQTVPATLAQAVPRGAFSISAPITQGSPSNQTKVAGIPGVHSSDTGYSLSLGRSPISCGGSTGDADVTPTVEATPSTYAFSASWGWGVSGPTASISASMGVSASLAVSVAQGLDCTWSHEWSPTSDPAGYVFEPIVFFVGDVPVVVVPELMGEVDGTAAVTGTATASVTADATVSGGASYADRVLAPTFHLSHSFTYGPPSLPLSGDISVAGGARLYLDLYGNRQALCLAGECDKALAPYLDITAGPDLTVQPSTDPWWQLSANLSFDVGLHVPEVGLDVARKFTYPVSLIAPPRRPTALVAVAGNTAATMTWSAPAPDRSKRCAPVTGYTVYVNGAKARNVTMTGATSATVGGLVNGTSYRLTVAARSIVGPSAPSEAVTVVPTSTKPGSGPTPARPSKCTRTCTVWAWGYNENGQLGNGGENDSSVPVQVSGLTGVTAISGGSSAGYALKSDGTVWAWGYNGDGELGDGTTAGSAVPVQVSGLTGVTAISGGSSAGYALKSDGTVWAWGDNSDGELGDGTTANSTVPVQVKGLTGVTAISGGGRGGCCNYAAYALKSDGTVWAWGDNEDGELGDGTTASSTVPVQVKGLTGVTAVSGGGSGATVNGDSAGYARKSDGTVWAWGYNGDGELGDGTTAGSTVPVQVKGLTGVTAISGGDCVGYALKSDGTVWSWGGNWYGQLGDGTAGTEQAPDSTVPVRVSGLTGVTATSGGGSAGYALAQGPLKEA
jgi:hypothetical protein